MKSKLYKKKLIILLGGPTASGKSKLAVNLAKEINGEIINADSMQVYKYFPILTSQPSESLTCLIRHHLYGYLETNKNYNGSIWLKDSISCIENIFLRKKIPIVVGGTGLYLEFMSEGISLIPKISMKTKIIVKDLLNTKGLKSMYNYVKQTDPEYANKISSNDKIRISRYLEVFFQTKKNMSYYHKNKKNFLEYDFFKIFLSPPKEKILKYSKVRFYEMVEKGLLDEFLQNKDNVINCNISKAIGFQELTDYFVNKHSLSKLADNIILNTKKYAKRQYTWFNNRYNAQLKIDSYKKKALVLESLSKII